MWRIWNAACITKVTSDGRTEQETKIPQDQEEHDNESKDECTASNQGCDSDGSNGRHLYRSERSAGSRRGRRPALFVPTQTTELPNYPATDELAS